LIGKAAVYGIRIKNTDFIRIEQLLIKANAEAIQSIQPGSELVFTSYNAVEGLFALIRKYKLRFPNDARVFSLDGKTKERIRELFPDAKIAATARNAATLAKKLLKHQAVRVVFFCGNLRRDDLPDLLIAENIDLTEIALYKTEASPIELEEKYDGYVFFSPSGVQSFFSLNTIDTRAVCFAIGETTAECLKAYTSIRSVVSDLPRQENMIKTIISHFAI
jgi:uroporphyrinogen-III synthase